ncbi:ABC transporter substrate-binding protein [Hippea sp. KM1]|uniref:ABC transporter substrate-binding protein n=1 Tax=Hippea sp. KM1 TaxID=944481 RepID=UPI00046CE42A|nr:helical backbone metal receptor [Hippea sp. KM1]
MCFRVVFRWVFYIALFLFFSVLPGFAADRIVSLTPVATKEIFMLKKGRAIVGCSRYGVVPKGFKVKRVGSVVKADIETILKLKPDIVIVSSLMNLNDVKKMRSLGLNVVVFRQPKSFDDICNQMIRLAKLIHSEDIANDIVKRARDMVFRIKKATEGLKKPKVFVQIGANPLFTAGGDSFINDFITFAGGINIASDVRSGIYSPAEVIRNNPDAIIISQMGFDGERQAARWRRFAFLNAVKNNKILILNDYSLCSPDPLSFAKTLLKIAKFLHPEVDFENLN